MISWFRIGEHVGLTRNHHSSAQGSGTTTRSTAVPWELQWCSSKKWAEHWQTASNNHHNNHHREIRRIFQQLKSRSPILPWNLAFFSAKRLMMTCSVIYVGDHLCMCTCKDCQDVCICDNYIYGFESDNWFKGHLNGLPNAKNGLTVWDFDPKPHTFCLTALSSEDINKLKFTGKKWTTSRHH